MNLRASVAAAAFSLLAVPVSAATIAETSGSLSLSFADLPDGVFVDFLGGDVNPETSTDGELSSADADFAAPGGPLSLTFSTFARSEATADEVARDDLPFATARLPFFEQYLVANTTAQAVSLSGVFSYDLSTSLQLDDPATDSGLAEILISFEAERASGGFDRIVDEALRSDAASVGGATASDEVEFTLLVPAGRQIDFTYGITARSNAFDASAVAPIPLPAGLPLLAAALGGLALLRRRA